MRIYLAGPMTGIDDLNAPAFAAEARRLRALGFVVFTPVEICEGHQHEGWKACVRRDLRVMLDCDAIGLLPGWTGSRGAILEHAVATAVGLAVHEAAAIAWRADRRQSDHPASAVREAES